MVCPPATRVGQPRARGNGGTHEWRAPWGDCPPGESRYGAPQLQLSDELSTVQTSPLGQV